MGYKVCVWLLTRAWWPDLPLGSHSQCPEHNATSHSAQSQRFLFPNFFVPSVLKPVLFSIPAYWIAAFHPYPVTPQDPNSLRSFTPPSHALPCPVEVWCNEPVKEQMAQLQGQVGKQLKSCCHHNHIILG